MVEQMFVKIEEYSPQASHFPYAVSDDTLKPFANQDISPAIQEIRANVGHLQWKVIDG